MKKVGGLLGVVIALGIGYFIFKSQVSQLPQGPGGSAAPPKQIIDTLGVKNDLIAIAQAERLYLAANGSYATVDQLQQDGSIAFSGTGRRGYNYVAEIDDGQHFKITATPADPAKDGWPKLAIDETMQVTEE
jgi:hypothetical protein